MTGVRVVCILVALAAAAGSARAQRWGGGPNSPAGRNGAGVPRSRQTGGGSNAAAPQWGGSPPQARVSPRARIAYFFPANGYIPVATAAPAPVPVTYAVDAVYTAAPEGPVEMNVVRSGRAQPELTTMDVYRQQRFKQP